MHKLLHKILLILDGHPTIYGDRRLGQSALELALVTPILLILIAGTVEIGWFAQDILNLQEVSRVGARRAAGLTGDLSPLNWDNSATFPYDDDKVDAKLDQTWIDAWRREWARANFNVTPPETDPYGLYVVDQLSNGVPYPGTDPFPNGNGNGDIDTGGEEDDASSLLRDQSLRFRDVGCSGFPQYLRFYNLITCTMHDSMNPMQMKYLGVRRFDPVQLPPAAAAWTEAQKNQYIRERQRPEMDDIVISVFAIQVVNNDDRTKPIYDDRPELQRRTLEFATDASGDVQVPAANMPAPGWQVMVVGRWPSNANECNVAADGTLIPAANQDRDPFDYIFNGGTDLTPLSWGNPQQEYLELPGIDATDVKEFGRGFQWRGLHRVESEQDRLCYGSEFSDERIEELMLSTNFIGDDPDDNELLGYLPNHGLVLVEIFWRHDLLLQIPGANSIFNFFGSDHSDIFINVWAAFPAQTVEPRIVYGPQ